MQLSSREEVPEAELMARFAIAKMSGGTAQLDVLRFLY